MAITHSGTIITVSGALYSGTATGGGSTTLTDSSGGFSSDVVGRLLFIYGGTGANQIVRRITAQTSTQLTVMEAFDVTPDSTSQYMIGYDMSDILTANDSGAWGVITGDDTAKHYHCTDQIHLDDNTWSFLGIYNTCLLMSYSGSSTPVIEVARQNVFQMGEYYGGNPCNGCRLEFRNNTATCNMSGSSSGSSDACHWRFYETTVMLNQDQYGRMGEYNHLWTHDYRNYTVGRDPADWNPSNLNGINYLGQDGIFENVTVYGINYAMEITGNYAAGTISGVKMHHVGGSSEGGGFYTYSGNDSIYGLNAENMNSPDVYIYDGQSQTLEVFDSNITAITKLDAGSDGSIYVRKNIVNTIKDINSTGIAGVKGAIYDTSGTLQDQIETSVVTTGLMPEIECTVWTDLSGTQTDYNDFVMRLRKYGIEYVELPLPLENNITESLKLTTFMYDNDATTLNESSAGALTGITINYTSKTVTISEDNSINDIYDYCQWSLVQDANMDEVEFLKSQDGNNFTFGTDWKLLTTTGYDITGCAGKSVTFSGTGLLTLNGGTADGLTVYGDVLLDQVMNISSMTINGDLDVDTSGTYNFTTVTITGDTTNSSAGTCTINALTGSSFTTTEPGTGAGQVNIVNSVPITVTVKDADTLGVIQGARVYLETSTGGPASSGIEIINSVTNVSGVVSSTYNYISDQPVVGRVRKGSL